MCAGEEHLLDVCIWPGHGIDMSLVLMRCTGPLSSFDLVMGVLTDAGIGNGRLRRLFLGFPPGAEEWNKLDAMFIESQGMAEMQDSIVRARERQVFWDQSDGLDRVPTEGVNGSN